MAAAVLLAVPTWAHGIAGNRCFPGTLTFDDPAVAGELFISLYSRLEHPNLSECLESDRSSMKTKTARHARLSLPEGDRPRSRPGLNIA